ncbi:Sex peptide receptor [Orchesella cincta]|uniref:Sex peptide receptor n=1 Tax=Orchesella cincta TaxID=48709 RepID=A0A1D2NFS2_ORCCI|nr:Sex peptide receptor [Orchesella cincta]
MMEDVNNDYPTFGYNGTLLNDTFDGGDLGVEGTSFTTSTNDYCGTSLRSFEKSYRGIHGFTSLIVCLFGVQANILNLIVLTRKEMINPTNAILTGLALADLLNMVEYIPYALTYILPRSNTYSWALYILIHSNFSQVCHTISIWLTVTLAVWRYIMVAMHTRCRTLCSMERAKWAIASAYITSPILCIPIYLSFSVTRVPSTLLLLSTGRLPH